ncbi:MAG: esterase-like activity of phytase family protein [Notoacmeibacter sp.]|nr:esterase-like activity of phytase family protein [Notoacmeibacter sp.]
MRRAFASALAGIALLSATPVLAFDVSVETGRISRFRIGSPEVRFGPLEFVGGLEMVGDTRHFGAISAFRFRDAGNAFVAVTDTGFWLTGRIGRDGEDRPAGVGDVRMDEMRGADGKTLENKYHADAEGLAVRGDLATVSFERNHRISEFRLGTEGAGRPLRDLDFLVPARELRSNRGFETVAFAPADSPLQGARVVVSEKSLDKNGNIFGAVLEGPKKGIFAVRKSGEFDITDGAFLPGGDLVILERSFSMAVGVGVQLRRIDGATIGKGALLDGKILFTANMAYQIDNMEGMDIWIAPDGTVRLSLVSDDNHSILQRSLYLEFKLAE